MTGWATGAEITQRLYKHRPLQARSFDIQAAALGLDPANRSPLEASLGYALLKVLLHGEFGPPQYINLFLPYGAIASIAEMPPIRRIKEGVINVAPGCWVDAYQSDFLIFAKAPNSKAIARGTLECDGFDYHDRTIEQGAHDRKRDRDFQEGGIAVLRFTGSDIYDRPEHCASEALRVLLRRSMAGVS